MKTELMLVLLLLVLLSACGQKGPLYLPDEPEVQDAQAAAAPAETGHE